MEPGLQVLKSTAARYIAGALPAAEAQAFEAQVRADPALVGTLGLGAQLERAMRLLDADEIGRAPRWWRRPAAGFAAAGVAALLAVALLFTLWRWDMAVDRQRLLESQAAEGFLAPVTGTRTVKLDPELSQRYTLDAGRPERVDLHVALRTRQFNQFRLQLARMDGTFVGEFNRLVRDSNGSLRIALNTSALPTGGYRLDIEGLTWRGEPVALTSLRLDLKR
jgi:hypothetical protein